jgi:hypothetical protein
MQAPVEIHYAGVVVARAEEMREVEGGDLFIATKEPLPVGTLVGVSTPEAQFNVRVAHVVETVDGADNGMRVRRLGDGDPGASLWVPPPPAKPAPAPERVAAPVVEGKAPEPVEPAPLAAVPVEAAPVTSAPLAAAPEIPATPAEPEAAPVAASAPAAEAITSEPAKPQPESVEAAPAAEPSAEADSESAEASEEPPSGDRKAEQMPLIDDLPPARRTQGGNARRRTKKRK